MSAATDALLRAYPGRFAPAAAQAWVQARRQLLTDRLAGTTQLGLAVVGLAVSSGCAATGARSHAQTLADDAAHALARLEAGLGPRCEVCDEVLVFDRLDSAPAAVRCTGCVRAYRLDTRWCR